MIKSSNRNDLCLLILLPANDSAKKFCNHNKSSLICQIQIDSDHIQNGLVYTCIKQPTKLEIFDNLNIDLIKSNRDIQNHNNNTIIPKKKTSSLLNSLKDLTIEQEKTKPLKDLIKQRQVKINKKFLSSSSSSSSSPITDSNIPHTFSLWYNNKKKI